MSVMSTGPLAGTAVSASTDTGLAGCLGSGAACRSCALPGNAPDTHAEALAGMAVTCRLTSWQRCLPEYKGRSAAGRSMEIDVPSGTGVCFLLLVRFAMLGRRGGASGPSGSTVLGTRFRAMEVDTRIPPGAGVGLVGVQVRRPPGQGPAAPGRHRRREALTHRWRHGSPVGWAGVRDEGGRQARYNSS